MPARWTTAWSSAIVHTVTLSNASSVATTYSLSLADVNATGGGIDYTSTLTNAAFSNGVTIAAGIITVPAGVTSFTVSVPTTADTIAEGQRDLYPDRRRRLRHRHHHR